jgi:hypothetical protein
VLHHVAQDLPGLAEELEVEKHGRGRFADVLGLAGDLKLCITKGRVGLDLPAIQDLVGTDEVSAPAVRKSLTGALIC